MKNWPFILLTFAALILFLQGAVILSLSINGTLLTSIINSSITSIAITPATNQTHYNASLIESQISSTFKTVSLVIFAEAILLAASAYQAFHKKPTEIKGWLIMSFIVSIASVLTGGGVIFISSVLGVIGSGLGLFSKSRVPQEDEKPVQEKKKGKRGSS